MPTERNLVLGEYDIGEWRYKELKAFCRQYPEKKARAASLLGVRGMGLGDGMPHGKGTTSDPVSAAVSKREELIRDVEMIDRCLGAVDGGAFEHALRLNVCYGSSYDCITPEILPTSKRNTFFEARRKFFCLLDAERNGVK